MKAHFCLLLAAGLLLASTNEVWSIGRVYARIPNSSSSPVYNLRIKSLKATVAIHDQLAVTSVDQTFANDNALRLEGFYVFTLPPGAQVHEMYLWINGVRTSYAVKKREDAVVKYTEIVSRIADPAILEQLGSNTFRLRIFPFEAYNTRRIEIQYSQPLTYYKGNIQYVFPLDMSDYSSQPIETASLSVDLRSQLPITGVQTSADQSPTAVVVTRKSDYHYTVTYGLENVAFSKDFAIRATIDRTQRSMISLTYVPPEFPAEAPYYLLWSTLPDSLAGDSIKTRELTFVADVSSSMEGDRLVQLKDALWSFIDLLTDKDRFNIIAFSTGSAKLSPDLTPATMSARDSARAFVSKLTALGLTNFEEALHQSFMMSYTDPLHASIIFVTDGQPSWGEISPDSLLKYTSRWNTNHVRLFPLGVGNEADYTLLERLATQTGGAYTKVAADDSIYITAKDLYRRIFLPRVHSVAMDYGSLGAYDVHPTTLPDLFAGDQLMTAGRFTKFGSAHLRLTGTVGSTPLLLESDVTFFDTTLTWQAVGRYWGARKIKSILDLISIVGQQTELVDQVIALSIKYSVLTPYTAFLVVEPASGASSAVEDATQPLAFGLRQNFPNPFNPVTRIRYTIGVSSGQPPVARRVKLAVYDILGREVAVLVEEFLEPGNYEVVFDASGLSSGIYVYRLIAGTFTESRVMVVVR
jgi:Ca-activated chloride channel homolog